MSAFVDRWWRIVATGFCFAVFGAGGLFLLLVGLPLLYVFFWNRELRTRVARTVVREFFKFFIGLMNLVGVISYEVHGLERLQRPGLLVLANHPSLIDVIFIISLMPSAGCVVKSALARNPFTKGPVTAAGYITNDEGVALVDDCRTHLAKQESIVIFPEGTRTPLDGSVQLQRGAANVAIRCRQPVTPVSIGCVPRTLTRKTPWYRVPVSKPHFTLRVHEDLPVDPFLAEEATEPVAVRRLNEHLRAFFERESVRAAS